MAQHSQICLRADIKSLLKTVRIVVFSNYRNVSFQYKSELPFSLWWKQESVHQFLNQDV